MSILKVRRWQRVQALMSILRSGPIHPHLCGVNPVREPAYLVPGDARRSSGKSVSGWTFISPRTPCGCRITPTTTSSGAVAGGCAAAVLLLGLRSGP